MTFPRFSLKWTLGVVTFVALCSAALADASIFWMGLFNTLNVVLLLASIVGVIYGRGVVRAFAGGFAIYNGTILVLMLVPWFKSLFLGTFLADGILDYGSRRPIIIGNLITAIVVGYFGGLLAMNLYSRQPD